jgi:integrating conjugative element protein (TIGR03752 family)
MKSNALLKWLLLPMVALLVFVGAKLLPGGGGKPAKEASVRLTPAEAKALGIEGDTPRDTVATLVGQVKQLRAETEKAIAGNKAQTAENERLRQREGAVDQRIQNALEAERQALHGEHEQTQGLLQELQQRLEGLGGQGGNTDMPVGFGLKAGEGDRGEGSSVRWIEPEDAKPASRQNETDGTRFPSRFGAARKMSDAPADPPGTPPFEPARMETSRIRPVYTVPMNATLMGSVAMTALIGRIAVEGTVHDPYPFKILIGADNLTANGIEIPDVAGAVVSGTASGDWTLSCVRGLVRSVTFVFNDGTIRTLPESGSQKSSDTQDGLGWISDPYGIPCVTGERRSNAQQYLGTQALLTAAGAGAASLIKSDNGRVAVVSGNDGIGTVGISGNEAMGRILAGGVQDMSQWVNKLYGQAFAAVYVKPGAQVAVHLDQTLTLDYDPKGRKVDHRLGDHHHAQNLD